MRPNAERIRSDRCVTGDDRSKVEGDRDDGAAEGYKDYAIPVQPASRYPPQGAQAEQRESCEKSGRHA